ncbi:3-isopropylmalate dehydrogenase (plasmid) [Buchnera aphidicola (Tuberolachnus salignus)]|uniref:3-isopropylmalate dehydrogenase n=1 Tax=Buchnera aphidicola subsp. Tuberolachnus salignus TaxID=98804 RepID=A0A160SXA3_BUCTT|nr:3-isopropylmalate dehydrogenase [Buchnera aphidicola]CUR53368.1 3-isopropylmalate dehydrogenase [Buchnera aphidicola (Tuberolachnus salignus)]
MKKKYKIAVLPGDGIGPEIIKEAYKIISVIKKKKYINLQTKEYDVGGIAIDKYNIALPEHTLIGCQNSDAILFGSVGGPKWNHLKLEKKPEISSLLSLRKFFNLFINLRPVKLHKKLLHFSPLKTNIIKKGFDILFIRELTGGIYFGVPKGRNELDPNNICAFDTAIYNTYEITRIAQFAFQQARKRKKKLVSIDKSNVLESSKLWREVVTKISYTFPEVQIEHLYVDNAAMQLIQNPSQFDVILCPNLFGDILTDESASLIGSLGMLPSASLNQKNFGLYEPAGGSAPDLKGKNLANPIAQILSLAMLFKYSLGFLDISEAIEHAVITVLKQGHHTYDISDKINFISTDMMGTKISENLMKIL